MKKIYKRKLGILLFGDLMLKSFHRDKQIKRCQKMCIIKHGELILSNSLSYVLNWNGKNISGHVVNICSMNLLKLLQNIKLECPKIYVIFNLKLFCSQVVHVCLAQATVETWQVQNVQGTTTGWRLRKQLQFKSKQELLTEILFAQKSHSFC